MTPAAMLADPEQGLTFASVELSRRLRHLEPAEAVELAADELRKRGAVLLPDEIQRAREAAWGARLAPSKRLRIQREESFGKALARLAPVAEPEVPTVLTPIQAKIECDASVERRRELMGLASRALRYVDYAPGGEYAPPSWLIKNVFPRRGLGTLYGETSAGKSFLAIHAALCIARGVDFFGKRTRPGGVLYIAAEGGSSVLPRIEAADAALGSMLPANHLLRKGMPPLADAPFRVVTEAPNLSRDGDHKPLELTIRLAAHAFEQKGHRLAMVIVDTWHAALGGGDENAAADAGHALRPFKEAVEDLNLFTLIVAHPGKALEKGLRGSNALPAAVDTSIELAVPGFEGPKPKPAGALRRATVNKQRDGEVGAEFHYRLPVVELGKDEDGDPWTTCTVLPCDPPKLDAEGLKPHDRDLLDAVRAALAEANAERADIQIARGRFYNKRPDAKPDARRQAWGRALKDAITSGRVAVDDHDNFIWIPTEPAGQA